jgi:predicted lactoylglutathione lyase
MKFFSNLGFSFNPQFTDDTAACMSVSDGISVMLLTHPKFKTFPRREICDTARHTELQAGMKSMKWSARRARLAAQPSTSRKTTA